MPISLKHSVVIVRRDTAASISRTIVKRVVFPFASTSKLCLRALASGWLVSDRCLCQL